MIELKNITKIILFGVGCITVAESVALVCGVDGAVFNSYLAVVGGVIGYSVKKIKVEVEKGF